MAGLRGAQSTWLELQWERGQVGNKEGLRCLGGKMGISEKDFEKLARREVSLFVPPPLSVNS